MKTSSVKKLIGVYKNCLSAINFTDDKTVKKHYKNLRETITVKMNKAKSML